MTIPKEHAGRFVYHFTHIDNLPGLLKTGFLANNHIDFPKESHRSVAAQGIQERRSKMLIECGTGGCVHDYVPLYFGARSPMLLSVINVKNVDQMEILYFEFPISLVTREDVIFSDASANTVIPPNFYADPNDLHKLNWEAIDSKAWGSQDDTYKHSRMAEMLVYNNLPLMQAVRCVVWNDEIKIRVEKIVATIGANFPPIEFESQTRRHWFTNFQENKRTSVVAGPREIAMDYETACEAISEELGKHEDTADFEDIQSLLEGLKKNFGCLPHTAELVNLRSENGIHKKTVDKHTQDVVANLLTLDEFSALNERQKLLAQLAAYLHDIGKGPRSRWDKNGGLQKVDPNHPVGAMPMMVEILTNHVGKISQKNAEILTKLVCYHDLVGDVIGKGRDENQIISVVKDKSELDMLFALCRADATALVEQWWDEENAEALYNRCLSLIEES